MSSKCDNHRLKRKGKDMRKKDQNTYQGGYPQQNGYPQGSYPGGAAYPGYPTQQGYQNQQEYQAPQGYQNPQGYPQVAEAAARGSRRTNTGRCD